MTEGVEQKEINSLRFQGIRFDRWDGQPLFDGLDFDFPMNSILRIKGSLGSGVSTLLKMTIGLVNPRSGSVFINGDDVTHLTESQFRPYLLSIGSAFDPGGLISHYSLSENLMLPLLYHSALTVQDARERAARYLKHFELFPQKDMRPGAVSSGTRKACSLARAFMLRPQLLILDEPTLGLGRGATEKLVEIIELHRKEFGMKHIILGSEDELFLSYFDFQTIDIQEQRLRVSGRQLKKEGSSGR